MSPRSRFIVLLVLSVLACSYGQTGTGTADPTEDTTDATAGDTTAAPTEAPTTAPTEAPTEAPTTAPKDPTTEAPTPVPTSSPSTPAPVDPRQPPKVGSWNVTEGGRTCIQSKMGLRIGFTYVDSKNEAPEATSLDSTPLISEEEVVVKGYPIRPQHSQEGALDLKSTLSRSVYYDVPTNVTDTDISRSTCGSNNTVAEKLAIGFFSNDFQVALTFSYSDADKSWVVSNVAVNFVATDAYFPEIATPSTAPITAALSNQTLFQTSNGSSYQCVSDATLTGFVSSQSDITVNITTAELRVEAFRTQAQAGNFGTAIPCKADTEVSNIVPIAVGAALAALVIIVLIAYLIGRKKNKRGYESV